MLNNVVVIIGAGFSYPAKLPIQQGIIDEMLKKPEVGFMEDWDFETLKHPPSYRIDDDPASAAPGLQSVIYDGVVEIKSVSREAGDRSKIAVYTSNSNIDPIGACVGENSSRIREVVRALNGEKIDLYRWSENTSELIANALQPTNVVAVINIDTKTKTSLAIVPDNQLSLAIGKNGQNVRLAVQSCDWKIDIKPVSVAKNQGYEW